MPQAFPSPRDIVLQTIGLTKAYGKRLAVKGLNLEITRGEVFGFLGPNGAGKTTTIRMLLNLIKPSTGEVKTCVPVSGGQALAVVLIWALILAGLSTYLFIRRDVLQ